MKANKKHLTLRIAKLKETIRRKYNSFKTGIVDTERFFEQKYKPIITEIKKTKSEPIVKKEPKEELDEEDGEEEVDYRPQIVSSPIASPVDDLLSTPEGRQSISHFIEKHFKNPITKHYMDVFMRDRGGQRSAIDHLYGPRLDDDGVKFLIGNKTLDFNDNGDIVIDNILYEGTPGTYELVFKRTPHGHKIEDLKVYKKILEATNAHRKGYKHNAPINSNSSLKYRNIIKTLFQSKYGSGIQWKSSASRDIVHWDDPNELIDRLRLLIMSAETGNTSHTNEIINIIEELREAGYIKGSGNKRLQSLLK